MWAQEAVDELAQVFDERLGLWDYLSAFGILVASFVLGRLVKYGVKRLIGRTQADDFLGDLFGRIASYVIIAFGVVYALESLGVAVGPILGALGIAGIAVAFALQDILENFVAGIILQLKRPFTMGDEVESMGYEGLVTAVDARSVSIRTFDGATVHLPSASVIKDPIVNNSTRGLRRTVVEVGVAYGTDLALATRVAADAARSVDGVIDDPAVQALVHTFGASSVDMSVRFWHRATTAEMWRLRDQVAKAIAVAFEENGIEIPFPQRVVHTVDD